MPATHTSTTDKAGKGHWDDIWTTLDLPPAIDPHQPDIRNYLNRQYDQFFRRQFSGRVTEGQSLLEIGCARSIWLPYFAREFGFQVSGLDYSEVGCRQAQAILEREEVSGQIICGDLFSPPESLIGAFDTVVSFGVAEHFEDTAACLRAFARYLKPGGLLITTMPNMPGLVGQLTKAINFPVYQMHIPLDQAGLAETHRQAGLDVLSCEYLCVWNLGVVNIENRRGHWDYTLANEFRFRLNLLVWRIHERSRLFKPNPWASPYIACAALKPGTAASEDLSSG